MTEEPKRPFGQPDGTAESMPPPAPPTQPSTSEDGAPLHPPGPPPGAPVPDAENESQTGGKGANKKAFFGVVGVGAVLFALVMGFVILVFVAQGSPQADAQYCVVARDLNVALDPEQTRPDPSLIRAVIARGEEQAPPEIVEAWTQLRTSFGDLTAPRAQQRADEAASGIYDHWVKACN